MFHFSPAVVVFVVDFVAVCVAGIAVERNFDVALVSVADGP